MLLGCFIMIIIYAIMTLIMTLACMIINYMFMKTILTNRLIAAQYCVLHFCFFILSVLLFQPQYYFIYGNSSIKRHFVVITFLPLK